MSIFASLDKRRWITAVFTLSAAFLCGYVMQSVLVDEAPMPAVQDAPGAAAAFRQLEEPQPLPVPPAATLNSILQKPPVLPDRADEATMRLKSTGCRPHLQAAAAPAATLRIRLTAPCNPNTQVSLRIDHIMITDATDADGNLDLRIPALLESSRVVAIVDGNTLSAKTDVLDARQFQNVVIQWTGRQVLRINAYEFGAKDSQLGHVWSGAPKSPARAAGGAGGYLTRLGNGRGASLESYSFPTGSLPPNGVVRLVVEADVTHENCGKQHIATALQTGPLGTVSPTRIVIDLPDCDQVGQTVHLQNLLLDLRLAAR